MAEIAIPPDLAAMFATCEGAYERAIREGYAENPAVIAAITALKSAWKALHVANYKLTMAEGFFHVEIAALRRDRTCQATREACINLYAAIAQAAEENRLYDRYLILSQAAYQDQEDDCALTHRATAAGTAPVRIARLAAVTSPRH